MSNPNKREEGELSVIWATTTDPSTQTGTDPEQDETNYTRVGLVADLSNALENETNSAADRDSADHQDIVLGVQSSNVSLTCNVQQEDSGGTAGEDAGTLILRDAAYDQTQIYWLIVPYENSSQVTGLEGVYSSGYVTSVEKTRDFGEFAQYSLEIENREKPSTFTT